MNKFCTLYFYLIYHICSHVELNHMYAWQLYRSFVDHWRLVASCVWLCVFSCLQLVIHPFTDCDLCPTIRARHMGVTIRRIVAIQSVASGTVSMIQGMNNMLLLSEVEVNSAGPNCECSPTLATTTDPLFPLLI